MKTVGKYQVDDWNRLSGFTDHYCRSIFFNKTLCGKIHVVSYPGRYSICFDFYMDSNNWTLLNEYKTFYSYESDIEKFNVASLEVAKNKVDLFLLKFDSLKSFL